MRAVEVLDRLEQGQNAKADGHDELEEHGLPRLLPRPQPKAARYKSACDDQADEEIDDIELISFGGPTTKASTDQRTITTPRSMANQPMAPDIVSLVITEAMLSDAPDQPSV